MLHRPHVSLPIAELLPLLEAALLFPILAQSSKSSERSMT